MRNPITEFLPVTKHNCSSVLQTWMTTRDLGAAGKTTHQVCTSLSVSGLNLIGYNKPLRSGLKSQSAMLEHYLITPMISFIAFWGDKAAVPLQRKAAETVDGTLPVLINLPKC